MQRISHDEFAARRDQFDAAVARTPGISKFCSSSTWCLAAREHLFGAKPGQEDDFIWRDEGHPDRWLLFGRSAWWYWQPFEAAWLFACPMVGSPPEIAVEALLEAAGPPGIREKTEGFVIGGIPEGGELHQALRRTGEMAARGYREYPATDCLTIDLDQGWESWLARRSRKFRRSLDAADRRCRDAGLEIQSHGGLFETVEGGDELFERILAIQTRTAKWESGTDIFQDESYRRFYRQIFRDLRDRGGLRVLIATRAGRDVAHIFGGVFAGEYRGLQMSYAAEVAHLGVGNWLQWENIRLRSDEGIRHYDLGMEAPYKLRWADERRKFLFSFLAL